MVAAVKLTEGTEPEALLVLGAAKLFAPRSQTRVLAYSGSPVAPPPPLPELR
jgi:hypothetical protein